MPFCQAGVGFFGFRSGDAEPAGLGFHDGEQRQVVFIEQDGCAGEALEAQCSADVVDVGVGDEDLLQLEAELGETAMDAVISSPGSMTMASLVMGRRGWCSCTGAGRRGRFRESVLR
jgi:hypothetical protein